MKNEEAAGRPRQILHSSFQPPRVRIRNICPDINSTGRNAAVPSWDARTDPEMKHSTFNIQRSTSKEQQMDVRAFSPLVQPPRSDDQADNTDVYYPDVATL